MSDEQIEFIKNIIRGAYPEEDSVTGYRYEPRYCGKYEGKLIFRLTCMPPKECPDSRMYVGWPQLALVDPKKPEQFEIRPDPFFKLLNLLEDKRPDNDY